MDFVGLSLGACMTTFKLRKVCKNPSKNILKTRENSYSKLFIVLFNDVHAKHQQFERKTRNSSNCNCGTMLQNAWPFMSSLFNRPSRLHWPGSWKFKHHKPSMLVATCAVVAADTTAARSKISLKLGAFQARWAPCIHQTLLFSAFSRAEMSVTSGTCDLQLGNVSLARGICFVLGWEQSVKSMQPPTMPRLPPSVRGHSLHWCRFHPGVSACQSHLANALRQLDVAAQHIWIPDCQLPKSGKASCWVARHSWNACFRHSGTIQERFRNYTNG